MKQRAPNTLGRILRYINVARAYARVDEAVKAGGAGRRSMFYEPLQQMGRGYYHQEEPVDVEASYRLAVTSPWLGSDIRLISQRVAGAALEVKRRVGEKKEGVSNHAVERLLWSPNPLFPGSFIVEYGAVWYLCRGNAYWFVSTSSPGKGEPLELWPLEAVHVAPLPDTLHEGRGVFAGKLVVDYEYTVQGRPYTLPGENVIHWRTPNLFDYWQGLSPLAAAQLGLQVDYEQANWLSGYYGEDNAVPTAIISLPAEIDDDTFDAAAAVIREEFGKKRRSAITRAGDLAVQVINQTLRDMELVASRGFNRDMLDRAFNVPQGLISGALSGDSRLAVEITFARNVIQPLLNSLAGAMGARLLPYYGEDLVLEAENVIPQDRAMEVQEFNAHSPFLSVNESREALELEPFEHELAGVPVKLLDWVAEERRQGAEGGSQRSEGGDRRSEGGSQRSEGGDRRSEGGSQRSEGGDRRSEGGDRRETTENRQQSTENEGGMPDLAGVQSMENEVEAMAGKALALAPDAARRVAMETELKRWRKVALRELEAGRAAGGRDFESDVLGPGLKAGVGAGLALAADEASVRAVFGEALAVAAGEARAMPDYAGVMARARLAAEYRQALAVLGSEGGGQRAEDGGADNEEQITENIQLKRS